VAAGGIYLGDDTECSPDPCGGGLAIRCECEYDAEEYDPLAILAILPYMRFSDYGIFEGPLVLTLRPLPYCGEFILVGTGFVMRAGYNWFEIKDSLDDWAFCQWSVASNPTHCVPFDSQCIQKFYSTSVRNANGGVLVDSVVELTNL
jgi:hypothetical protein